MYFNHIRWEVTRKVAGIKDIAKKAGYSISTVSYALNGSPKVTEETRARILQIAKELEYVPNGAARMLRARETKIIGCFLFDYRGKFYSLLLKEIRVTLNEHGYELIVSSGEKSRRLLLEKIMDGVIILDENFSDEELIHYANLGHKMVLLDRELAYKNIATVLLDNEKGAKLAVLELLEKNIEKLYIVSGPIGSFDSQQRLITARTIAKEKGILEVLELEGNFSKGCGMDAASHIVRDYDGKSVGVFCLNDEMAIGFYDYLKGLPQKVGKDFYVVGFDNTELASYVVPKLTTVDYSASKWGKKVADHLLQLLDGKAAMHEKINVKLAKGESC
jgi:LacI family transcriptional regulator